MTPWHQPIHPAIRELMNALDTLSNRATELDLEDAGTLSALQVRLGEIVLQITKIEAMRDEDKFR